MKRRRLDELFKATADAFQTQLPSSHGYSFDEALAEYARFTSEAVGKLVGQNNKGDLVERLYANSYRIGQSLNKELQVHSFKEVMAASEVIYRILKISFHGDDQGQITISKCFFSSYYTPEVCRIISSLDAGLLGGLSGGGRLKFIQRITEGEDCCKARLIPQEDLK